MDIEEKVKNAIIKKATGYEAEEVVEEYQIDEDNMTLTRKKISKKHYPPDTQAAKMLLDISAADYIGKMTDEEIKEQITRLIKEYEDNLNDENKT